MKKRLFVIIIACLPVMLAAQEKVQFEGTIRTHIQQENSQHNKLMESMKGNMDKQASSQKDIGNKLIYKATMKSALKKNDRVLAQTGAADGEFDVIKKIKGNKIIEFTPSIGKITIYDEDASAKIEAYPKYKVAVKSPFLTGVKKIYKETDVVMEDTATVNGILCRKFSDNFYKAVYYDDIIVYLSSNLEGVMSRTESVTDIIEEPIEDSLFEIPSIYKFVEFPDVVKLQMKDKKGIKTNYESGDPIPTNFWDFK
jgi:hypothetical protein